MQVGDKVVTSGGIYGKVKELKETTVVIEIAEMFGLKLIRTQFSQLQMTFKLRQNNRSYG